MKRTIIKTMLIISACAVALFSIFAVASIRWSVLSLKDATEEKCYYHAMKCANQISMIFENAEGAVDALASDILCGFHMDTYKKEHAYLDQYMDELSPVLKDALTDVEDAAGLYFTFNPELSGQRDIYEIWFSLDEKGQPVLTDATANGIYLEAFSTLDAPHMQYYFRSVENPMKGIWTDPCYDPDLGKDVLTYSKSVYVDKTLVGVLGVDILTDHTTDIISHMDAEPGGKVFLLNQRNQQIVASQSGADIDAKEMWSLCDAQLSEKEAGVLHTGLVGRDYLVSYGKLSNDWTLAIVNDKKTLFAHIDFIRRLMAALTVILTLLTLLVIYFALKRFASPVKKATELLKMMDLEDTVNEDDREALSSEEDIEKLVRRQIKRQREKDLLFAHQSRLAQAGEMISAIAHQWKQPLNKLSILLGNLRDAGQYGELTDEELNRTVERSEAIISSMSDTINDFRSYLLPDKNPEAFSVSNTIRSVLTLLEDRLRVNGIQTEQTCEKEYIAYGYRNALYHITLNVVNNAIDAIEETKPNKGRILIYARDAADADKMIELLIFNNGGSLPEEVIEGLFSPYVTTKKKSGGSGLGLAISKSLVEESMGGSITLCNCTDGVMCKIRIRESEKEYGE